MEDYLKKYGMHSLLISILLILVSLFLIFSPITFLSTITIFLGCIIAINGLIHTISYFSSPSEFRAFSFELIYGILGIVAGFIFVLKPEWIAAILPIVVGIWIIVESIIKFQLSINMREFENSHWILMLILSLVTTVLGLFIILHPVMSLAVLISLCGIMLLVSELLNVIECIYIMLKLK